METNLLSSAKVAFLEPAPADASVQPLSLNKKGHLRVVSKHGAFDLVTAALSTLNQQVAVDVTDVSVISFLLKNTGSATFAAGTYAWEGSIDSTDGTNGTWTSIQTVRNNSNSIETGISPTLAAGVAEAWIRVCSVAPYRWFRIRCTVAATALAVGTFFINQSDSSEEPLPGVQTHPVTISGTPNVAIPGGTFPSAGTAYGLTSAASTNAAVVKASAGTLLELTVFNPTAAVIYVKLYNKASAPTVGTDVPIVVFPVPVNGEITREFGALGKRFSTGIALAITAGPLATDVAAVAAGANVSATYI